jgi:hypothetical protein
MIHSLKISWVLSVLNITEALFLEGHAALPDKAEAIIKEVYAQIPQVVEWFS